MQGADGAKDAGRVLGDRGVDLEPVLGAQAAQALGEREPRLWVDGLVQAVVDVQARTAGDQVGRHQLGGLEELGSRDDGLFLGGVHSVFAVLCQLLGASVDVQAQGLER